MLFLDCFESNELNLLNKYDYLFGLKGMSYY